MSLECQKMTTFLGPCSAVYKFFALKYLETKLKSLLVTCNIFREMFMFNEQN